MSQTGRHQMPARGAMAGLRQDLQKDKDSTGYNPSGVGNAYSHNFLNQKPWHPANFRNQAKVYEAEQKQIQEAKRKETAKAEFQAEQDFLKTLSYLSPEEQQKFKERQGVQFLYMKPPGADSVAASSAKEAAVAPDASAGEPPAPAREAAGQSQVQQAHRSHVGNMLGAVRALQNHDKWEVRHMTGVGRSPPRGNADLDADNQQLLVSSSEGSEDGEHAAAGETSRHKRARSEDRLAEAEAVLRQAGYDINKLRGSGSKQHRKKKSLKVKKEKKKKRRKRE